MTAIILAWKPDRWQDPDYEAMREQVAETGQHLLSWTVSRDQDIPVGTDAWLLLQGSGPPISGLLGGLIAHGKTRSEPYPTTHDTDPDRTTLRVQVAFDAFLPFGEQLASEVLKEFVPAVPWDAVPASGLLVSWADEAKLRQLWSNYGPASLADPTVPPPGTYPDEALSKVEVNRYEMSPEARRACLAHHGTACAACGFSFEITYGEIGKDFIHVHHIVPAAQLGNDYELDPVSDLVPLCANCHAMAHQGVSTPRTLAELRRIMAGAGFLEGNAVSTSELQAQADARRILGGHTEQ